jgi:hypothetical protein
MGPEPDFTRRIPGLRIETRGTHPIPSEGTEGPGNGFPDILRNASRSQKGFKLISGHERPKQTSRLPAQAFPSRQA